MTRATVTRMLVGGFVLPDSVAPGERGLPRLLELEPHRVAFGHDLAIWQPDV